MPKSSENKKKLNEKSSISFESDFMRDLTFILEHYKEAGIPDFQSISFVLHPKKRNRGVPFEEEEIWTLELETRASHVLGQHKINTMKDLMDAWIMLPAFRAAGRKTVQEIKLKLISRYYDMLNFKEREEFWKDTLQTLR